MFLNRYSGRGLHVTYFHVLIINRIVVYVSCHFLKRMRKGGDFQKTSIAKSQSIKVII